MIRSYDAPLAEAIRQWHTSEHRTNASGMSGLGDAYDAAIANWQSRLGAKMLEIDQRFAGRRFTAAEIRPEIAKMFQIAGEFQKESQSISRLTDRDRKDIDYIFIDLGELYGFFGAVDRGMSVNNGYPKSFVFAQGDPYWQKALDLQKAPIAWLLRIGKPVLESGADANRFLDKVKDAPGAGIRWTLEQLLAGLGLPKWFLPVLGVTTIAGLGAWAYFTFLAPVSAASKTLRLRTNPRRRKRLRRS